MPRLFVAVEVPQAVRSAVGEAVAPLRAAMPGLRWVAPERYHLTLVFIGSVDEAAVPAVEEAVDQGCRGVPAFPLQLDGRIGSFGRRVIWVGVRTSAELASLAVRVAQRLGEVVPLPNGQRVFRAHLTVARAGRQKVRAGTLRDVTAPAVAWPVERIVLLRSAAGYEVVRAVDLAAATDA
ncbi:MAG: RNA 2',3'-cyclic phosphodiesterase [Nitriliruptorales bacterium]|nr:RNA 2',3'-cyclic phosphodiesterase [Nitriliruptorales bacterium]